MNQSLIELHYELSDALIRAVEPVMKRRAKDPDKWRISLICRNAEPGAEGRDAGDPERFHCGVVGRHGGFSPDLWRFVEIVAYERGL